MRQVVSHLLLALPSVALVIAVAVSDTAMKDTGGIFEATAILTGFTFTMAVTFWGKTIDARQSKATATSADILTMLDENFAQLVWTSVVGLFATGVLVLTAVFSDAESGLPIWLTAVIAFLVAYLVVLVGQSLYRFVRSALLLY